MGAICVCMKIVRSFVVNHKMKLRSLLVSLLASFFVFGFLSSINRATGQSATHDALGENLRLANFPTRDPWILADERTKTYYLYASNNSRMTGVSGAGVMAYKSKDLKNWQGPSIVFAVPEGTWADASQGAWAPEVHAYKGKFYLFVTLHNPGKIIAQPPEAWKTTFMRGTIIAQSDSPDGPFTMLKADSPIAPANFMSIDGTFYVDPDGKPWMVYVHEWAQKIDGTIEAVTLKDDLSAANDSPIALFKGSDAPWLDAALRADNKENTYVTDGPELYRTKDGHLLMLWSSFEPGGYVETVARSKSGQIEGPWEQLEPLFEKDGGHGMLFRNFDGQLMLVLHQTNRNAHAKLFEVADDGDHLEITREREDLDGGLTASAETAASMPNQRYESQRLQPTTDADMLQSLDMTLPGMEAVRAAAEHHDLEAVKIAYLEFRRKRSTPRWFSMPSDMPAATATDDATGDEILHHIIRDYAYGNFHRQPVNMGEDFDWTHNPLPETDPNFSHEWTWCGISRTQFWRKLGDAYWKTHDEKYAQEWVNELFDFARKEPLNPDTGRGPVSLWRTLDASIRANETWPYAYYHMRDSATFTSEAQWVFLKLMRDHGRMLERGLRVPGRSGNWVASESYGLYTIGTLFPEMKESAGWRQFALDRITKEMNTVVPPDGFEAELTPNYHMVTLHGYLGPLQLAELNHAPVPSEFKPRLLAMFEAFVKVMDQRGQVVATNDSGRANAIELAREGLKLGDDPLLTWAVTHGAEGQGLPDSTMLPYAGFYTMRSGWKPDDQFLFFRAGPPGIGHEHEDMLQLVYEAFGRTLLREQPESNYDHSNFRRFALNAGSYNDITVDGMTQHRGANRPPVTTRANVVWVTSPLFDYAAATYDGGYQKSVYNPRIEYHPEDWIGTPDKSITHTRRIVYLRPYYALVYDSVNGPGHHIIAARFNVASSAVSIDDKTQAAFSKNEGSGQIGLYPLERSNLKVSVLQGERDSADIVWNVPTVQFEKQQDTPATFATLLYPYRDAAPVVEESALPCANPDIWAHSIKTPYERASIFVAKSGNASGFSVNISATHAVKATASMLVARSQPNRPAAVLFGAMQLTEFDGEKLRFTLDRAANLDFTAVNGHPVFYNPDDADVVIKLAKPFVRTITVKPSSAVEVTNGTEQMVDSSRIFRLAQP